ncbi:uncharacterized protein [Panulirus ornatus]|uniref:uncharacterized protein n=1 Tax=Panulirus ornatus TaxID=150431 RepID=UPI003A881F93
MRALVFLVAVSCCSAQLVLPGLASWALPYAKLITTPKVEGDVKPVALASPYFHPLVTPYAHPYGYVVKADPTLKATEFPYIYTEVKAEEARRRRRRDVKLPLPYIHALPTVKKATVETKQYEPVEAATPADTTKIELTTKEHEVTIPAVKYVQPVVNLKPIKYTAVSPAVLPYSYPFAALPYSLSPIPVIKVDE